jgi:cystathionine gamma-synthase
MSKYKGASTRSIHLGEERRKPLASITTPVVQSSTFPFEDTESICTFFRGQTERNEEYGRYGNPTQRVAENKLAALEGGEKGLLFSSGMAAVTTTLLAFLDPDSHAILTSDCYKKTRQFANDFLTKFNVQCTMVEPRADRIAAAIQDNTKLIYSESPTNPYLNVLDLKALVKVAKKKDVMTIIDSTFATPYNQRPIEFGVDLVIQSCTKYLGGHNDLIAGAVIGSEENIMQIKFLQGMLGPIPSPWTSYLLLRGLKTFALRMERHNKNSIEVARFLEKHPMVEKVYYPGLESHPHHEIAKEQMAGYGGVVSFIYKGGRDETSRLVDNLKMFYITPSFGGPESLVSQPSVLTFFELNEQQRHERGINDSLVRLSMGLEDVEDIIADLEQALNAG